MKAEFINSKEELQGAIHDMTTGYTCKCVNGKCSNCGECCTDMLPVSERELQRIRQYAAKRKLSEHHSAPTLVIQKSFVDLSCPFRNPMTRRCDIYDVRPEICRAFVCTKSEEQAIADRDRITLDKRVLSMRWEVFQNPTTLIWMNSVDKALGAIT
jgi:Fe-S-cluster containining protein